MPARERQPRSEVHEPAGPSPKRVVRPADVRPADAASVMALQRAAGNRAVVQRLFYNEGKKTLVLPKTYSTQRLGWNVDTGYLEKRQPKQSDKTLIELVNAQPKLKGQLQAGLGLSDLGPVVDMDDAKLQAKATDLVAEGADPGLLNTVGAEMVHHNRLLKHYTGVKYSDAKELDVTWVMSSPNDFIAGEPDLPSAGTSVRAVNPDEDLDATYWEYMCVLIALVKADGYSKVNSLTKQQVNGLDPAVQALHDYYMAEDVQFDDSSTRMQVMKEWDYKLVFAGNCSWNELPDRVELHKGGKYIADIPGHTVMVEVKADIPKNAEQRGKPELYFKAHSELDNYDKKNELQLPVNYFWAKS